MNIQNDTNQLLSWQIGALKNAIKYDNANPTGGIEAKIFIHLLRKKIKSSIKS
jgi:hypothetical protein